MSTTSKGRTWIVPDLQQMQGWGALSQYLQQMLPRRIRLDAFENPNSSLDRDRPLDRIDPDGRRPDEWARAKGHLKFSAGRGDQLSSDWICFAFFDAASRRFWPNPRHFPEYEISEEDYNRAIATGPFAASPSPIKANRDELPAVASPSGEQLLASVDSQD